jgi:hypothetical protein
METSVMVAGVPAGIRTENLPITSQDRYRYRVSLRVNKKFWTSVRLILLNSPMPSSDTYPSAQLILPTTKM